MTLIEMMICVAILGISSAAAGVAGTRLRVATHAAIQQERAQLMLDYHAAATASGRAIDEEVAARLAEPLPDSQLVVEQDGPTSTLTLRWRDPLGQQSTRAVTVFRGTP